MVVRELPATRNEFVPGPDWFLELRVKRLQSIRIPVASPTDDGAGNQAKRAEPMQYRTLREAESRRKFSVDVQWIMVAGEPIKNRLFGTGLLRDFEVCGLSSGHVQPQSARRPRSAKIALVEENDHPLGVDQQFAFERGARGNHDLGHALQIVEGLEFAGGEPSTLCGQRAVHRNRLCSVHEVLECSAHAIDHIHQRLEGGDHPIRRVDTGPTTFIEKIEFIALCADAQRVGDGFLPIHLVHIGASGVSNQGGIDTHARTFGWLTVTGASLCRQSPEGDQNEIGFSTVTATLFDSLAQVFPEAAPLRSWLLGAACVLPSALIVPAFGLRAVSFGIRLGLALSLGVCVSPALVDSEALPFGLAFTLQALRGLPVAISAAAALWATSMAGGLIDELRHGREWSQIPTVPTGAGPTNVLFTMLAAIGFLATGGPARIAGALARPSEPIAGLLTRVVADLLSGVQVAIAIAVPFLVASILLDVLAQLLVRGVQGTSLHWLTVPLRALVFLILLAAMLDRVFALLVLLASRAG